MGRNLRERKVYEISGGYPYSQTKAKGKKGMEFLRLVRMVRLALKSSSGRRKGGTESHLQIIGAS